MALVNPVALEPVSQLGSIHFIGIGGNGMSGIAACYARSGVAVSGSDSSDAAVLAWLRELGIKTYVGHDAAQLGQAETVVISSAIRDGNVELVAARERELRIWHRSAALGALMLGKSGIAISGTHGKTTTSAMIAVMLEELGAQPSYVLGASLLNGESVKLDVGQHFIIEADESDGSFLQYPTRIAVITNIEADHLDNWNTPAEYAAGFLRFTNANMVKDVVLPTGDVKAQAMIKPLLASGKRVHTFAVVDELMSFTTFLGNRSESFSVSVPALQVPGVHNLKNAAAAFLVGSLLGYPAESLLTALGHFAGTERRFMTVAEVSGVWIVDDYAHHPTELRATLAAARTQTTGRVIACFQPHLYTRTRDFATELGQALAGCDHAVILDVYPARELPIPGVSGELVAAAARAAGLAVTYVPEFDQAVPTLARLVRSGDLVITLGAGNVTNIGSALARFLQEV